MKHPAIITYSLSFLLVAYFNIACSSNIKYYNDFDYIKDNLIPPILSKTDISNRNFYFKAIFKEHLSSSVVSVIEEYRDSKLKRKYVYTYSKEAPVKLKRLTYSSDNKLIGIMKYKGGIPKLYKEFRDPKHPYFIVTYSNGHVIEKKWLDPTIDKPTKIVKYDPKTYEKLYENRYKYDSQGKITEIETYRYDRLIESEYRTPGDWGKVWRRVYSPDGKLIEWYVYSPRSKKLLYYYKFKYKDGKIFQEEYSPDGKLIRIVRGEFIVTEKGRETFMPFIKTEKRFGKLPEETWLQ